MIGCYFLKSPQWNDNKIVSSVSDFNTIVEVKHAYRRFVNFTRDTLLSHSIELSWSVVHGSGWNISSLENQSAPPQLISIQAVCISCMKQFSASFKRCSANIIQAFRIIQRYTHAIYRFKLSKSLQWTQKYH